jgi:hypothetical protein
MLIMQLARIYSNQCASYIVLEDFDVENVLTLGCEEFDME